MGYKAPCDLERDVASSKIYIRPKKPRLPRLSVIPGVRKAVPFCYSNRGSSPYALRSASLGSTLRSKLGSSNRRVHIMSARFISPPSSPMTFL